MSDEHEVLAKRFKAAMDPELRAGVKAMIDVRGSNGTSHPFVLPLPDMAHNTAAELIHAVKHGRSVADGDMYTAFAVFVISLVDHMVLHVAENAGITKGSQNMVGKETQNALGAMRVSAMAPLEQITAAMEMVLKQVERGSKS